MDDEVARSVGDVAADGQVGSGAVVAPSLRSAQDHGRIDIEQAWNSGAVVIHEDAGVGAGGGDGQAEAVLIQCDVRAVVGVRDALDGHVGAERRGVCAGAAALECGIGKDHIGAGTGDEGLVGVGQRSDPVALAGGAGEAVGRRPDLRRTAEVSAPEGGGQGCGAGDVDLQVGAGAGDGRRGVADGEVAVVVDEIDGRRGGGIERTARAAVDQGVGARGGRDTGKTEDVDLLGGVADGRRTGDVDHRTGRRGADATAEDQAGTGGDVHRAVDGQLLIGTGGVVEASVVDRDDAAVAAKRGGLAGKQGAARDGRAAGGGAGAAEDQRARRDGGRAGIGVVAPEQQNAGTCLGQRVDCGAIGDCATEGQDAGSGVGGDRAAVGSRTARQRAERDRAGAEVQALSAVEREITIDGERIVGREVVVGCRCIKRGAAENIEHAGARCRGAVQEQGARLKDDAAGEGIQTRQF